jgi:hypothetical protein
MDRWPLMSVQLEPLPKNSHPRTITTKNGANFSSGFRRTMPNKPVDRFGRIAKKNRTPREKSQWLF